MRGNICFFFCTRTVQTNLSKAINIAVAAFIDFIYARRKLNAHDDAHSKCCCENEFPFFII